MATRAGAFLIALAERSKTTFAKAAAAADVSQASLSIRVAYRPGAVATTKLLDAARACGATDEDIARLEVLDAMDRGALLLPKDADEGMVQRALAVLRGAA